MTHDWLAESLAAHLRAAERMVWTDMQLGPVGSPRPDVYAIYKSYVRPCPTAYEVKVSKSDFRADVTTGKWESYLKYASAVYFACEGDLIKPSDLPPRCGLIVYRSAWRVAKKAISVACEIPESAWLKLLIDGVNRATPRHSVVRDNASYKTLGADVAEYVRDKDAARFRVQEAEANATRLRERADREFNEHLRRVNEDLLRIAADLGIPAGDNPSWYQIRNELNRRKQGGPDLAPIAAQLRRIAGQLEGS